MNSKQLNIVLGVVVVILLIVVGYMATRDNTQPDTLSQTNTSDNVNLANSNGITQTNQPVTSTTPTQVQNADKTVNWKTYTNASNGYSIKYPQSVSGIPGTWVFEANSFGTLFGPASTKSGGYVWGVNVYDKNKNSKESLISSMGEQFSDRKESRQNITVAGNPAVLVTVTTQQNPSWVSKAVYIEKNNMIYQINNGAIDKPEFVDFYNSFKFVK